MSNISAPDLAEQLVDAVAALVPQFLEEPIDREMSGGGNAAFCVIAPDGRFTGRIFGMNPAKARWVFGIASRKVMQVRTTGYATGRFEELVYSGQLDESPFGINRPDFIGWPGGVPLQAADGSLYAAAFSGFRGEKDVEIVERAASAIPGLSVKRD